MTSSEESYSPAILVFGTVFALLCCAMCCLTCLPLGDHDYYIDDDGPGEEEECLERCKLAEKWLVSRKARVHDHFCQLCREDIEEGNTARTNSDDDISELTTVANECTICYEPIHPGDIVSWSLNQKCNHTSFHHACLKRWTIKHKECPFCREILMPIDEVPKGSVLSRIQSRKMERLLLESQCRFQFYCADHGVVDASTKRHLLSTDDLKKLECIVIDVPSATDLQALRGESTGDIVLPDSEKESEV